MADVKEAPPKKPVKSAFPAPKAADLIIYRLIKTNERSRPVTPLYPPYRRFPNTDVIKWKDGERAIRYLRGFDSIFVDEQEQNGRVIPKAVLDNPNNKFEIIDGEIKVRPHEKTKIQFLDMCNRNVDSPYRTDRVEPIFARYSEEKAVENRLKTIDKQKRAMELAFNADEEQLVFHAKQLGIPLFDGVTSATRTIDAVKADYRQKAIGDPDKFLETYDDEGLKTKYLIERALADNMISLTTIPGVALWTASKTEICPVPVGGKLKDVVEQLFMFSETKSGIEFINRVREYYK